MGRESFLIARRDAMSTGPVSWRAATASLASRLETDETVVAHF